MWTRERLAVWIVFAGCFAACAENGGGTFAPRADAGAEDARVEELDAPPLRFDVVTLPDAASADVSADAAAPRTCAPREVCGDGLDNDCNDMADDGCTCIPGTTQACYLAAPSTAGVGLCVRGTQRCEGGQEFGRWSACAGAVGPAAERCDGMDNDCDGTADNGCACRAGETRGCYAGPEGTRGVGACADGMQRCFPGPGGVGSAWGDCTGDAHPGTEACDGVDNDCDGATDNGCGCRMGEARPCYGGAMGTQGVGPCRAGTQTCVSEGGATRWGACSGQTLPGAELCDAMDNDCDGTVDDGCACRPGETRGCYSGALATRGVGACRDGAQRCVAGGGGVGASWGACEGEGLPRGELCDDVDNNCDGAVDEGCACRRGQTSRCYSGPMGSDGVGVCRAGTRACVVESGVARWGECAGQALPGAELCDGVDNDCDGTVDNGCACRVGATQPCYNGPMGTQGVGACRAGSQSCVAGAGGVGSNWSACTGQALPGAEQCNTVDDNCNGMVDDGISCGGPTIACPAPRAVPAGTVVTLSAMATGLAPLAYRWEVTSAPTGASYVLGAPTASSTTFTSVIVGAFTLRVTVTDAQGRSASCVTTVTMQGRGLRVELIWDSGVMSPTTAGRVDLDLHLHNRSAPAWFQDPEDCFFRNRNPRWDVRNSTADDPALDVDNLYGFGPENIRVDAPVPTTQTYSVGVNYFEGTAPVTATTATVRIYCGDVLRGTYTRRLQGSTALANANDFWRVARVTFSDASTCAVSAVDDIITTYNARIGNP